MEQYHTMVIMDQIELIEPEMMLDELDEQQ
jgi:hypothetical protein